MSLTVSTDIPHGNAADLHVRTDGDVPEVSFSPSPKGGPEALWFCFRICETEPDGSTGGRILLTLNNFQNLLGAGLPSDLYPAYQPAGQGWRRMSAGAGSTCRHS
ncbi:MAG: hypothetical protein O2923_14590 [Verrucomicrobia bacterium]|nr:hypothetical protein [Verrucomicrobiota bacterium]